MPNPARPPTFSLQEFVRLSRAFEEHLAQQLGVNSTDLSAMEHLIASGPLPASELARRLKISPPAITAAVDRLVALGHVTRGDDPDDRRRVVVTAVDASAEKAMSILRPMITEVDATLDGFTAEEQATIAVYLDRVLAAYRKHTPQ